MNSIITEREYEIFTLLVQSYTTDDNAKKLNISTKTARNHISNVIGKLGVTSRTQAIIMLLKNGLIKID